jgi:hypothetical protein
VAAGVDEGVEGVNVGIGDVGGWQQRLDESAAAGLLGRGQGPGRVVGLEAVVEQAVARAGGRSRVIVEQRRGLLGARRRIVIAEQGHCRLQDGGEVAQRATRESGKKRALRQGQAGTVTSCSGLQRQEAPWMMTTQTQRELGMSTCGVPGPGRELSRGCASPTLSSASSPPPPSTQVVSILISHHTRLALAHLAQLVRLILVILVILVILDVSAIGLYITTHSDTLLFR